MAEKDEKSFTDKMKGAMDDALDKLRPKKGKKRKAEDVPLGEGMAGKAKKDIQSRKSRLDKAIEDSGG